VKIGYLMNSYPMTSTTFIRREIESLEALGIEINRYGVRHWSEELVDPDDIREKENTHYLLTGNILSLFASFLVVLFSNPFGFFKGLSLWFKVATNAGLPSVKQLAYFLQATAFYRLSKKDEIEHVHFHFSTNATTVAMLVRAMGGVSYSFTAHGPDEFVDPTTISMSLKVQYAAFVVAISNYCRVQLVRYSSYEYWDKIVIAHCGLHIDNFTPSFDFSENNQSLICVGRLCPQKAQLLFPAAVARLKNEFPKLHINLIGDGESREGIEEAIKQLDVSEHFTLHGWMVNEKVREMVKQNRALLLPSFAEGLPVVIMEAFALGRPVISTYIAGIPELVDDTCGWMIPAGSIDDIEKAIRSALTAKPKQLMLMGQEGRKRVEAEYDLSKIALILEKSLHNFKDK